MSPRFRHIVIRTLLGASGTTARPEIAAAKGVYSQIVVSLETERDIRESYETKDHSLTLTFPKTAPAELGAFERYDPRLVRRIIIRDLGPSGSQVKLVLRDANVKAFVKTYEEPFRITVDLFDSDYADEKEPGTGLPLIAQETLGAVAVATSGTNAPLDQNSDPGVVETKPQQSQPTRKLLQPSPQVFENEGDLARAMSGSREGPGAAWKTYPAYIYRAQTAPLEGRHTGTSGPSLEQALSSNEMMAAYAARLYDFGHESRALLAYQQVLHKDPTIFDRDALHLWKFAEVHLGQGNLTLARGYYEALAQKHPASPLAPLARLRILDVSAIRYGLKERSQDLPNLLTSLTTIPTHSSGELSAQVAIRKAFWENGQPVEKGALPLVNGPVERELREAFPRAESSRTAFLVGSLILASGLREGSPWSQAMGPIADEYFKRFAGPASEPYRTTLKEALYRKINQTLQKKSLEGQSLATIQDFESLPASMQSVQNNSETAWALAEAYRSLGQPEKAMSHYTLAEAKSQDRATQFKAAFWLAFLSGESAVSPTDGKSLRGKITTSRKKSELYDQKMASHWGTLQPKEKEILKQTYREAFEKTLITGIPLKTPARIVLSSWKEAFSTNARATSTKDSPGTELQDSYSPSGAAVILLADLARRFSELGLIKERRETLSVMKEIKPKDFEDDAAARDIWAKQLTSLAEDYRKANQYLDAGRLFTQVGDAAENSENRAETLYKGGLLLYRAGRRDEAIASFKKAADDTQNLFYANLAKERLAQLQ